MKHLCLMCAVLFSIAGFVRAEEPATEESDSGGLTLEAEIAIPSSYVFRGYVLEEDHFIVQPQVTIGYDTQIAGLKVSPYITAWGNLTDMSAPGEPEWFNELDIYLGADIELPSNFTLGVVYNYYNSPADVFDDVHELGITLSHEDVLNPSIGVFREICDKGGTEDTYIELSVTPGFDVPQFEKLHLDFPLVLGVSPDKYYLDSNGDGTFWGYCSAGVTATYALNDHWSLTAGVSVVQMLADSVEASNKGDEQQYVGSVSVKYSL
jgi:hypothetical protein